MLPSWLSTLASVGMAIGPPLTYVDQAVSIFRKRDSTGFSRDVCAILLLANIMRCFFWIGAPFELALLVQSINLILSQLILLYLCVHFQPAISPENLRTSTRPFGFWQWHTYPQYVEFLAGFILCSTILFLIFGRSELFVHTLGFVALGLESTLPIPQLISNYKQRSLYGFRASTLLGWVGGDAFKTIYFFVQSSPIQFTACAIFQLSIDCVILVQRFWYGNGPPPTPLLDESDLEQALALAEE